MTLHHDLIEQANHLAIREPKKPRQASLRRAVSAAYYSLFHMLCYEASHLFFPNTPAELRSRASRAFAHGEMKSVCEIFAKPAGSLTGLTTSPLEPELNEIASTFNELQEARHKADYDIAETFDRVQVLGYVQRAKDAMTKWKAIKHNSNANAFLAALLLHTKWNKFNK